ncbi:hypothetical protein QFC19_005524 [Naganishia cerealis]|uniref:Uncharacterized protein n=1 Tax=Naganishia cerealis TaxID=610337 RepID=A0ACC2VM64_9TREE|nr:hypothetical protein QFC19_005524 [Naganishia cerealis]
MDFATVFSVLDVLYKETPLEDVYQFGDWLDMIENTLRWNPTLWLYYKDKLDEDSGYAHSPDKEALKSSMDKAMDSIVCRTVGFDTLSHPQILDVPQGREQLYAVRDSFQNCGVIRQMNAYKEFHDFINDPSNSPILKYKKIRTFPYMNLDDKGRIVLLLQALADAYPLFQDRVLHLDLTTELKYADLHLIVQYLRWSSPAISTETGNLQPKRIKRRRERPYCHFCRKIGHDNERCYKKNKRLRTDHQTKAVKDLSELEYTLESGHSNQYPESQVDANEAEAEASGKILFKAGAKRFLVDGPISFLDPRLMN